MTAAAHFFELSAIATLPRIADIEIGYCGFDSHDAVVADSLSCSCISYIEYGLTQPSPSIVFDAGLYSQPIQPSYPSVSIWSNRNV